MSALTGTTKSLGTSTASRLMVLKPAREKVTTYVPGRRSTMRYWPLASVTEERTRSISASLAASTVTPGRTAPEVSLTIPAMDDWASAAAGSRRIPARTIANLRMTPPLMPNAGTPAQSTQPAARDGTTDDESRQRNV